MNSSYSEEMDILINDFNRELKNILNGRDISELGVIDLRRLKHEYETVHELNLDLQERARVSRDVDTEELRNILTKGDQLYESNRVSLVNIQEVLNTKVAIGRTKLQERREVTTAKNRNLEALSNLRATLNQLREQFRISNNHEAQGVTSNFEARVVYEGIISNLENNINELEELDRSYDDRLAVIETDLSAIRFGGPLSELQNIAEETTGLTQEQAQMEAQRINEELDNSRTNEEEQQRRFEEARRAREEKFRLAQEEEQRKFEEARKKQEEEQRRAQEQSTSTVTGMAGSNDSEQDLEEVNLNSPLISNTDDLNAGLSEDDEEEINLNEGLDDHVDLNAPLTGNPALNNGEGVSEPVQGETPSEPVQNPNRPVRPVPPVNGRPTPRDNTASTPPVNAGSLEDLVNRGILPKNISSDRLLEVCGAVGLAANDMTFKPTQEQLARLKGDMVIQKAIFNQNMVKKHQSRINQYDKLIAHYDSLLADKLQGDTFSAEYISKIASVRDQLAKERAVYQGKIDRINAESLNEHLQFDNGRHIIANGHINRLDRKEERKNDKIRDQYAILDEQRREKETLLSRKMKNRMDKKIEKTLRRIEKLQAKKSKVTANQTRIINDNSAKYISKMSGKLSKHSARQRVVDQNVREITGIRDRINNLNSENRNLQQDAATLTTSFRDRIMRASLEREGRSISREIARLSKKQGKCDRRIQHIQHVNVNRGR